MTTTAIHETRGLVVIRLVTISHYDLIEHKIPSHAYNQFILTPLSGKTSMNHLKKRSSNNDVSETDVLVWIRLESPILDNQSGENWPQVYWKVVPIPCLHIIIEAQNYLTWRFQILINIRSSRCLTDSPKKRWVLSGKLLELLKLLISWAMGVVCKVHATKSSSAIIPGAQEGEAGFPLGLGDWSRS